ncbi:MAG TPA: serine hydrolase [Thermoanaerobaculia bacterium]|nr:serine hydrolase [Thermoanaerobaculia bacterium]
MKRIAIAFLLILSGSSLSAEYRHFAQLPVDAELTSRLSGVAEEILKEFASAKQTADNLSMTVIDLSDSTARRASYHGELNMYPASVVKLFFMVMAYDQIERGEMKLTPELQRGLRDMIVDSNNDATAYIVDRITGTTSGEELSGRAEKKFMERRRSINRFFDKRGYSVGAMLKAWCEGPYGRDKMAMGPNRENRNRMTSDQVAALMYDLVSRRAVSPRASDAMLELMQRDVKPERKSENQVKEFTGEALPAGSKLWSKAGWTSEVRHDAAYVELPNGRKYILVACTRGAAGDVKLLPAISKRIVALFSAP